MGEDSGEESQDIVDNPGKRLAGKFAGGPARMPAEARMRNCKEFRQRAVKLIFVLVLYPFGTLLRGNLSGIFHWGLSFTHQFFHFWVKTWVRKLSLISIQSPKQCKNFECSNQR